MILGRNLWFDVLIVFHLCNAAWVTAPLKKKQAAAKEREALKTDEQSQHEDGGGSEGQMDGYVQKILAGKIESLHDHTSRTYLTVSI